MIDNYDSFSFILLDSIKQYYDDVKIIKNDEYTLDEVILLNPERLIISPGPNEPSVAGITMDLIAYYHDKIPILGVCLGHQAIGVYFGAECRTSGQPLHGKVSRLINVRAHPLFENINLNQIQVMHYHSLVIGDFEHTDLRPLADSEHGFNMAIEHKFLPIIGVQFHPESILTEDGAVMLKNWVEMY